MKLALMGAEDKAVVEAGAGRAAGADAFASDGPAAGPSHDVWPSVEQVVRVRAAAGQVQYRIRRRKPQWGKTQPVCS